MAVGALAIILVSYSESIATATDTAARHKQEFSPDQELIAQGAAWVGSSLVGGFPGCGSLSKTAVSESSGQKTQLAGLSVAGLTVLTLLFLAGMFSNLPQAVLGAVVIDAALGLIHFKVVRAILGDEQTRLRRLRGDRDRSVLRRCRRRHRLRRDRVAAAAHPAASKTPLRRMAYDPADQVYVEADTHPDATTPDGVLVVKVNGPLFFADAAILPHQPPQPRVGERCHDRRGRPRGDTGDRPRRGRHADQGPRTADRRGLRLLLAHADTAELDLLRRAGTLDAIGEENIFATVRAAVAATT